MGKGKSKTAGLEKGDHVITRNRKALHNYFVDERYEAGIVLLGTEVKSLRDHKVQLVDAYARFDNNELWLLNAHINPYALGTHTNHEPMRPRKLLMHKRELRRLRNKSEQAGVTLIPLSLYIKDGRIKCELGLCRGKKQFDKRESIRKREAARDIARNHAQHHRLRQR
jgi:SsrA-binding protein